VGVLLLIVRRFAGDAIVDSVVKVESSKARSSTRSGRSRPTFCRDLALAILFYGLFALLAGILAGPSRAGRGRATLACAHLARAALSRVARSRVSVSRLHRAGGLGRAAAGCSAC
jgi:hypothetical protein